MKKFMIGFLALMVAASPSFAAKKKEVEKEKPELTVSQKECEYLTAYEMPADVEYQPGVDVHGKPVMEADITPSVIKPPENTVLTSRWMWRNTWAECADRACG